MEEKEFHFPELPASRLPYSLYKHSPNAQHVSDVQWWMYQENRSEETNGNPRGTRRLPG